MSTWEARSLLVIWPYTGKGPPYARCQVELVVVQLKWFGSRLEKGHMEGSPPQCFLNLFTYDWAEMDRLCVSSNHPGAF